MWRTEAGESEPVVYIVDDDVELCESLSWLLDSVSISSESFNDVQSFLAEFDPERPACLILDVRMPRTGGFQLQDRLNQLGSPIPVVFVSAHADVAMSVRALRNGAVNFLEKPYDPQQMLDAVQETMGLATERFAKAALREDVLRRLKSLTPREREILGLVIDGLPSQNIARRLGTSVKTVDVHRARIRVKSGADSIAALVRDVLSSGVDISR
ncbi:response regulator [Paenarthrobacter nitroguajacolicus]|uniref:response regulator transcription factor n=1 Tax=Paenarthrobacter nitroguajacolicus TaxID=211146 RepID=UPI0028616165|nr:response regulator [Paenarthrobacter nitroguajacolicus]MDR6637054.1 FixJ family two-component response regulator [Paenarthrobacter nitroguajacolicus]